MRRAAGASLLTTLAWIGLVASLGLALAGLSIQHLSALTVHSNRQEAQNLARSVVSMAIERLLKDPDFCKTPTAGQLLTVQLTGCRTGSLGLLSFDPATAQARGIAGSVNNLDNTLAVRNSANTNVPAASALLIGEGRSGSLVGRVQAILAVPPFPYALAAAGPIRAERGVTLGALASIPDQPVDSSSALLPADLLSNDAGAQAIFLGPNTRVSGDVKTPGQVSFDPTAPAGSIKIEGLIKAGSAREKIPVIPLSDYDPQLAGKPFTPLDRGQYSESMTVGGSARRQGSLEALQGLKMDGGALFVDGDLTVHGGLTGKGLVAASGKITIDGQSDLVSGSGVALLARGDLNISGSDAEGSYFQGLVYTEGNFGADKVSIVGTLVASGQNANPVTLRDSRILQVPPAAPVVVTPGIVGGPGATVAQLIDGFMMTVMIQGGSLRVKASSTQQKAAFTIPALGVMTKFELGDLLKNNLVNAPGLNYKASNMLDWYDLADAVIKAAGGGPGGPDPGGAPVVTTVNPSSFLRIQDRIRVVLWKEEE